MGQPEQSTAEPVDLTAFRETFRAFQAAWQEAMEDGAEMEDLILALEAEGVELPPFVRQLL